MSRRQTLIEIALIFAVFFIQGAWPVPDVNEPYYVGKAIHYWNPDWLRGDFFMESPDTHKVFCFAFGWLSLWLTPVAMVWTGRILTWLGLAWAWRRLSVAVVPRPWYSVLTAALFACLMERCHMAGEWLIGGVEAKGFAYVFVFLGLEALVRNRWNRALLLVGAASAFHVLVGGWVAVAMGLAWLWLKFLSPIFVRGAGGEGEATFAPTLRSLWPGIVGGILLALPGLAPSLSLDWGVAPETARLAHQIYVFERLPHHLTMTGMHPEFILRLALLWVFWLLLPRISSQDQTLRRLRAFVAATVAITLLGAAINLLIYVDRALAAGLLRYYWFRLTDVALPLGVALEVAAIIAVGWKERPTLSRCWLAMAVLVAAFQVGERAVDRLNPAPPRSFRLSDAGVTESQLRSDYADWRSACDWVATSGRIPPGARFLTPRLSQTFMWYSGHSEVATWKNVPQDAQDLVQWRDRIQDIYMTGQQPPEPRWHDSLAALGAKRLKQLGEKYHAQYVLSQTTATPFDLPVVYSNPSYVIYRLR